MDNWHIDETEIICSIIDELLPISISINFKVKLKKIEQQYHELEGAAAAKNKPPALLK